MGTFRAVSMFAVSTAKVPDLCREPQASRRFLGPGVPWGPEVVWDGEWGWGAVGVLVGLRSSARKYSPGIAQHKSADPPRSAVCVHTYPPGIVQ